MVYARAGRAAAAPVRDHCIGGPRWAVLDDLAARGCAAAHRIQTVGTLGIVLCARASQQIDAARPLVEALRAVGMFLDDRVIEDALVQVGE